MSNKRVIQRGRPSKRSSIEIILERGFLDAFASRGLPVNKTATHLFGWIVGQVEKIKGETEADGRRERLIRDFERSCLAEGQARTWRHALAWYVRKG